MDFKNFTDAQLRQEIGRLQSSASSYLSPVPQQAASSMYQKNLQAWSSTPTPPPRIASAGTSSRPTRSTRSTRASNLASSSTPAPTTSQFSNYAYTPAITTTTATTSYLPRTSQLAQTPNPTVPAKPKPAVQPVPQAFQSTYASRLRTGATLLMQPIISAAPVASTSSGYPAPLTASTRPSRSSRRTGTVINYADPGSGDDEFDFPDAGAIDEDDDDFVGGSRTGRGGGVAAQPRGPGGRFISSTPTATSLAQPIQPQEVLDKSYLGLVPPEKYIKSRTMKDPTPHQYPTEATIQRQSLRSTALVPIRVEFDTETHRIRDCFVWNAHDDTVTPEQFAKIFCFDLDLPQDVWAATIANQIKAQLEDSEGVATMELGMDGAMEQHSKSDKLDGNEMGVDEADVIPECRVILSIDVQIANYHLMDHIEWDLLSPLTPESFATTLCRELGLAGEAVSLVAHAVHEELIKHKKDAVEWGVIAPPPSTATPAAAPTEPVKRDKSGASLFKDKTGLGLGWGRAPKDGRGPKPLRSVWRDWTEAEEFRTRFEELTQEEVERRELERERAARRLRRETSKFQSSMTGVRYRRR